MPTKYQHLQKTGHSTRRPTTAEKRAKDNLFAKIADMLSNDREGINRILTPEEQAETEKYAEELNQLASEARRPLPESPSDTLKVEAVTLLGVLPDQSRKAISLPSNLFPLSRDTIKQIVRVLKPEGSLSIK